MSCPEARSARRLFNRRGRLFNSTEVAPDLALGARTTDGGLITSSEK